MDRAIRRPSANAASVRYCSISIAGCPHPRRIDSVTISGAGFFSSLFKKAAMAAGKAALKSTGEAVKQAAVDKARKVISGKGRVKINPAALPPKSGLPSAAALDVAEARVGKAEQMRAITQPVNTTFVPIPKRPMYQGDSHDGRKTRTRRQAKSLDEINNVNEAFQEANIGGNGLYRPSGRGLYR